MTAPNHAMTGALIGLSVVNPWFAIPLAFLSHFACDAIPHYDPPGKDAAAVISSKRLLYEFVLFGGAVCFAIVLVLAIKQPQHWLLAAICAFMAASPDLFWLPRFIEVRRTGRDRPTSNPFLRFHSWVQWKTAPSLIWFELVWFAIGSLLLWQYL